MLVSFQIALPEHTRPLKQLMSACNVLPTRTLLLAARAASVMLAIRAPAIHAPRAHLANSRRTLDRGRALTVQQATILTNSLQSSATIVPLIRTHRQEVWNVSVMQVRVCIFFLYISYNSGNDAYPFM